jgi:hypothetical protein
LAPLDCRAMVLSMGLSAPPVLFSGAWSRLHVLNLARGRSLLCETQPVIEGVVVKSHNDSRKVAKVINEEYDLLQAKQDGTDFH